MTRRTSRGDCAPHDTRPMPCRKPNKAQIAKRMLAICEAEGLRTNDATLQQLAEGANGDIRLVLGQLQIIRLRSRTLDYDRAKARPPLQRSVLGCGLPGVRPASLLARAMACAHLLRWQQQPAAPSARPGELAKMRQPGQASQVGLGSSRVV